MTLVERNEAKQVGAHLSLPPLPLSNSHTTNEPLSTPTLINVQLCCSSDEPSERKLAPCSATEASFHLCYVACGPEMERPTHHQHRACSQHLSQCSHARWHPWTKAACLGESAAAGEEVCWATGATDTRAKTPAESETADGQMHTGTHAYSHDASASAESKAADGALQSPTQECPPHAAAPEASSCSQRSTQAVASPAEPPDPNSSASCVGEALQSRPQDGARPVPGFGNTD